MSLERIREAVLAEARAEAQKIESEARKRHEEELRNARENLEAEFSRRLERAKHGAERESRRQTMARRAEHNHRLLKQRNAILDDLFRRAAEAVKDLPDEEYRSVLEKWMRELPKDIGGEVVCAEADESRLAPLVEKLNRARSPEARLKLTCRGSGSGAGVVFRTEKFEIDLSLDSRLQQLREDLAPEVSSMLFSDDVTV